MPRPCAAVHDLQPEQCRLCFLFEHNPLYRELWGGSPQETRPPGMLQQVAGFTQALWQHAQNRFQKASKEMYEQRLEICQACEFFRENHCLKCGCRVAGDLISKAKWQISKCPIGKW